MQRAGSAWGSAAVCTLRRVVDDARTATCIFRNGFQRFDHFTHIAGVVLVKRFSIGGPQRNSLVE